MSSSRRRSSPWQNAWQNGRLCPSRTRWVAVSMPSTTSSSGAPPFLACFLAEVQLLIIQRICQKRSHLPPFPKNWCCPFPRSFVVRKVGLKRSFNPLTTCHGSVLKTPQIEISFLIYISKRTVSLKILWHEYYLCYFCATETGSF